ncbi:flagellar hook capping FlgD N-terminal domain-containing protein [Heyndrickxia coagulans]|nr:flagellar hook capping FlgD N-terminal domain-containing protein [Heyndrickxia coagulans]
MTSIDPSLLLSNQNTASGTRTGSKTLDKNAFLKILIAQLQNQDPTNPMDDTQFVSQMAQFSSLEQMTNLKDDIDNLIKLSQQS